MSKVRVGSSFFNYFCIDDHNVIRDDHNSPVHFTYTSIAEEAKGVQVLCITGLVEWRFLYRLLRLAAGAKGESLSEFIGKGMTGQLDKSGSFSTGIPLIMNVKTPIDEFDKEQEIFDARQLRWND
ncbi:hypothetical protein IEQ34_005423 [Dendrobium chrysotoxum]|uniref:Uncharacterized protein n=1 Tax=Dendrobium chrysotoxum TaxID=161865 RepID=A0AAV7HCY7_DENCH|nr:hypothetical protein IEQ34_005423 [Dendrobium chrysotoxum]